MCCFVRVPSLIWLIIECAIRGIVTVGRLKALEQDIVATEAKIEKVEQDIKDVQQEKAECRLTLLSGKVKCLTI